MAHLHHNLSIMVKGSGQELLRRYGGMRLSSMSFMNERRRFKENKRLIIHCCTSSTSTSSSADQQLNLKLDSRLNEDDESELGGCLVRDEKWQVRRMLEKEMSQVASVQAEAFHEPVFLFDDFFFYFFEVIFFHENRTESHMPVKFVLVIRFLVRFGFGKTLGCLFLII